MGIPGLGLLFRLLTLRFFTSSGKANTMRCAKVEIRVNYTEAGPPTESGMEAQVI